jgi:hypothetical protein
VASTDSASARTGATHVNNERRRANTRTFWFAGSVTQIMRCLRWLDEVLSRRSRRQQDGRVRL